MSALLDFLTLPARLVAPHAGRRTHRRRDTTSPAITPMAAPDHNDQLERSA